MKKFYDRINSNFVKAYVIFDIKLNYSSICVILGYRDAQIGWIWVDDESEEKLNKRYALYLIIYAPRRGLLEVTFFVHLLFR